MAKELSRARRVAELVQRELADLIRENIKITGMLTISTVKISPDLQHATVYITVLGGNKTELEILENLQNQAGTLRYALSQRLNLLTTPRLHFLYDKSLEYANRINELLYKASQNSSTS